MLSTLRIKNLALVADLTLELGPGFNAITGETGAGKSIIIGALNLVLGERADRTLIRTNCDSCSVEAVLDVSKLRAPLNTFLPANGLEPCEAGQLVLKRVFSATGSNRQFVNGSPTTLNILATLGQWLVDIHGPHDHQSLLRTDRQLAILDAFGKLEKTQREFAARLAERAALEAEKAALIVDERTYAQQLDLLRFQVNEIAGAKLQPDEEDRLEQDYQRAHHAARLLELSQSALDLLSEADGSLLTHAGGLGRTLQEVQRLDAGAAGLVSVHEQAVAALQELHRMLTQYAERIELDPSRLQQLEERLNLVHALKRKYGTTLGDVVAFGERAAQQLRQWEARETELGRLQTELRKLDQELWLGGQALSKERRKLIPALCKAATRQLADLGFKQGAFSITIHSLTPETTPRGTNPFSSTGVDTVEFQFAPNVGEPPRPLRAIASSGEMARVMLALKTVLAAEDDVPVLVFDEVDANVGGETAPVLGEKMKHIGRQRQVLCITHLAPVAAAAANHYVVTKQVKDGRTNSDISRLGKTERVTELCRMLGGHSDAARRHAEALLQANGPNS